MGDMAALAFEASIEAGSGSEDVDAFTVLVCGGSAYFDQRDVQTILGALHDEHPDLELVHGATRGADTAASRWAYRAEVPVRAFPANWLAHGSQAGLIRNRLMLDEGQPDLVVAFPGGGGTADLIHRAIEDRIPVLEVAQTS